MTKHELAAVIAEIEGITKQEAIRRIDQMFEIIKDQLVKNGSVKIQKFGTFRIKKHKAKMIENPKTKIKSEFPERNLPIFIPSNVLKALIKNNHSDK